MIACFDAGNSRLKWGLADKTGWREQGALEWSRLDEFSAITASWPPCVAGYLSCVARSGEETALTRLLADTLPEMPLTRLSVTASAGGVTNGYAAAQLGIDRWCALIGARALESRACLVVMAGTATTIDSLDAAGHFLGGMILPGLGLMRDALSKGTARLPDFPWDAAQYAAFPRATRNAMVTGCLEAQAGAVERAFKRLPGAACCLLSGGAAPFIAPLLALPVRAIPDLVLEGIRALAQESGSCP
jgi:type III pantothenate kinase